MRPLMAQLVNMVAWRMGNKGMADLKAAAKMIMGCRQHPRETEKQHIRAYRMTMRLAPQDDLFPKLWQKQWRPARLHCHAALAVGISMDASSMGKREVMFGLTTMLIVIAVLLVPHE